MAVDPSSGNGGATSSNAGRSGAYVAMVSLGVCVLLPYNCVLTAIPYFNKFVYPGQGFAFTSVLAYSIVLCFVQVYLSLRGELFTVGGRMSLAFLLSLLTSAAIAVFAAEGSGRDWTYLLSLATVGVLSVSNALLQSAAFGIAGAMGQEMSQGVMLGLGLAGIGSLCISSAVQGVENFLKMKQDSLEAGKWVSVVMFASCMAYTLLSIWVFFVFLRVRNQPASEALAALEGQRDILRQRLRRPGGGGGGDLDTEQQALPDAVEEGTPSVVVRDSETDTTPAVPRPYRSRTWQRVAPVLREVAPQAFNVWLIYVVTMAIFPGVMTQWVPGSDSRFRDNGQFFTFLLIGTFQVFDVVSRMVANWSAQFIAPGKLWVLTVLRIAFVPLFMLGQKRPEWSPLWGSDLGRFALAATMAFSNGLFSSWAMMFGPESCTAERREAAGMVMSCIMVTGIFVGTLLAFATQ